MSGSLYGDDDPDAGVRDGVTHRNSPFDTTTRQTNGDWPGDADLGAVHGYVGHGAYDVSSSNAFDGTPGTATYAADNHGGNDESHGGGDHGGSLWETAGYAPGFDPIAEATGQADHGSQVDVDGDGSPDDADHGGVSDLSHPGESLADFEGGSDGDGGDGGD